CCIPRIHGDFALAVWDGRTRTLVAARDAFGVRPIFFAQVDGALLVSSRLEALAGDAAFDETWAAGFVLGGSADAERTLWAGRRALPPGGMLTVADGRVDEQRWWRAEDFVPAARADGAEAAEEVRRLFAQAVRVRMGAPGETWSQLSGGLDSSSVVSMAQSLAEAGEAPALAGTVSVVDTLGDGDETRYSGAVVARWGVRNEAVADPWPWQEDGEPPTATDEPRPMFPYWARDRRMCRMVREAGGRVMLSGQGSDHYLDGPGTFAADLLGTGRVRAALRTVTLHAVAHRQSFYGWFWRNALRPLLPAPLAGTGGRPAAPPWVRPDFARRAGMTAPRARSRPGRIWPDELATYLRVLAGHLERGPFVDGMEVRYPFLHRPLAEFCLRLPVEERIRPGWSKWVLREAMRGILPETVRTRRGKGGIDARILWALQREAPRLRWLLRDPLIAQAGWVDADALRNAVERARQGAVDNLAHLLSTLSLETWLRVRAGAWTPLDARAPRPAAA
ncbi:asparagine synthetase B family protein, partial [Longimicrobium sp.]|uniref:asparagine synthetase B family protein n=1 Tax=Longimicrobium sp. TaxID=2029185 RepID=UPI002E37FB76